MVACMVSEILFVKLQVYVCAYVCVCVTVVCMFVCKFVGLATIFLLFVGAFHSGDFVFLSVVFFLADTVLALQ